VGLRAREHALQFSWDSSMEALFGRVYPQAMASRASLSSRTPARRMTVASPAS
jgi:hypothetical protein